MRNAYALLSVAWLVMGAGVWYYFHRASTAFPDTINAMSPSTLSLTSLAFADGGSIPSNFTCDGSGVSPALQIAGVPEGTKSLALIVDDPDVPRRLKPDGVFDHWVLFNISPMTSAIPEGGTAGTAGANGAGQSAYTGPCPPPQYEPSEHRYVFTLYALDAELSLRAGASKQEVLSAMQGHLTGQARLTGRYRRQ